MCEECGCGLPGETPVGVSARHHHDHDHDHEHGAGHHHGHDHSHPHTHPHTHGDRPDEAEHAHAHATQEEARRTIEVRRAILDKNDRLAERNRGFFRARGLLVLNFLSSPGSGKTTFIRESIRTLGSDFKAGVIVGDLATDNDAQRLRESGAPVVQITTGTVCHLEAEMVARAVRQLDLAGLNLLIIENVGNLVCPASYDLGEDLRVVVLSVTEGEDKPLKYPPIFQSADAVVISKMDLAQACGYDRGTALASIRRVAPKARIFETSARTGQGLDDWREYLLAQQQARKALEPLGP
jgi:hydrogenase nickel incorporation protein HypB